MVETMRWENGKLVLLDQTKLPLKLAWIYCDTYRRVGKAIQKLEVRGAPAIGAAAAIFGWAIFGTNRMLIPAMLDN